MEESAVAKLMPAVSGPAEEGLDLPPPTQVEVEEATERVEKAEFELSSRASTARNAPWEPSSSLAAISLKAGEREVVMRWCVPAREEVEQVEDSSMAKAEVIGERRVGDTLGRYEIAFS